MSRRPRVAVIATGGTIDSIGKDRLDLAWYIENNQRLEQGELLQRERQHAIAPSRKAHRY